MQLGVGVRATAQRRVKALLGDPRVVALLQDPRLANALISLVKGVGWVRSVGRRQGAALAHHLGMVPRGELEELQRRLQRAEEEVRRLARRAADDENP